MGRSQEVSSNVPPRMRTTPSLGNPQIQGPHSGQTIGDALKPTWLYPHRAESLFGNNDPQENAPARKTLAIQAVAGIDCLRLPGDLVPDLPALTTSCLCESPWPLLMANPWSASLQ